MFPVPQKPASLPLNELRAAWPILAAEERAEGFQLLSPEDAAEFFLSLSAQDMAQVVLPLAPEARRLWLRLAPPDDVADLLQEAPVEVRESLLDLLDEPTRKEVKGLLAYAEDEAGGLMSPRYAQVRPEMSVDEAVSYLRRQARGRLETIYYIYVIDDQQRLLGVVSLKQVFSARPEKTVRDIMRTDLVTVGEHLDQEDVSHLFSQHGLIAIPVVDAEGHLKGIVTVDDIVDIVHEEGTEDIQKLGGMIALDAPYMQTSFLRVVRKRAGWLSALFLGEMLTATAMTHFQLEISKAVVLALFVPLIISSGGNSGSQASTLVVRAMALGEVRLKDWWRVIRRELGVGLILGTILGGIGFLRIELWQSINPIYGDHATLVAITIFFSLIGVVMFGTTAGSMLPFLLRRLGLDPATASAPFVATLVDVTGLVIYFSVAAVVLRGTLL